MNIHSVRLRLTLWNVGVLALVLAVLGTTLRYSVQAELSGSLDRSLARMANHAADDWANLVPGGPPPFPPPRRPAGPPRGRRGAPRPPAPFPLRALDLKGWNPFTHRRETPWDPASFVLALGGKRSYVTFNRGNEITRVYSLPLMRNGRVEGVVQAARPLTEVNQEVSRLTRTLLMLIPAALLIAAAGGAFLTDRALRPVRKITCAAERIEASDLSGRLAVTGGDEFAELATTFNGMLERLETAFGQLERALEQERRFTADASHELRTPLTIIKANSSLSLSGQRPAAEYRRALEAIDRAADTTNRIVQDLLLLARADAGQLVIEPAPIRLLPVLEQAREAVHPDRAPVEIDLVDPSLAAEGDAHHLGRLFRNLIENAARHTPTEGQIRVSAHAEGEWAVVTIQDTGEGIPPEHLPHVCERFYRVDAARSRQQGGTGLGLAICHSIVAAHDGALTIDSTVGVGTTVRVRLPRSAVSTLMEPTVAVGLGSGRQD